MVHRDIVCLGQLRSAQVWLVRSAQVWLVVGCVLLTAGCGWFSSSDPDSLQSYMARKQAFTGIITSAGGSVEQKTHTLSHMPHTSWEINLSSATISDEILDALIRKIESDYVTELDFSGSTLTDDQLIKLEAANIGRILLRLDLSNTGITDRGIDQLKSIKFLQSLNLSGTQVTTETVNSLSDRVMASRPERQSVKNLLGKLKIEL